jgi:hypothetical protein
MALKNSGMRPLTGLVYWNHIGRMRRPLPGSPVPAAEVFLALAERGQRNVGRKVAAAERSRRPGQRVLALSPTRRLSRRPD